MAEPFRVNRSIEPVIVPDGSQRAREHAARDRPRRVDLHAHRRRATAHRARHSFCLVTRATSAARARCTASARMRGRGCTTPVSGAEARRQEPRERRQRVDRHVVCERAGCAMRRARTGPPHPPSRPSRALRRARRSPAHPPAFACTAIESTATVSSATVRRRSRGRSYIVAGLKPRPRAVPPPVRSVLGAVHHHAAEVELQSRRRRRRSRAPST